MSAPLILASASPRRRELLEREGFDLVLAPANIDETRRTGEQPKELVERLAQSKAREALRHVGTLEQGQALLSADTIVWTNDEVLGKPKDERDACRMLGLLSGCTHHVSTGVCILLGASGGRPSQTSFVETTDVTFRPLSQDEILAYVRSGEPMDKAGAYGIQGGAGRFVQGICGDYNNVVGLPVERVMSVLAK